MRKGNAPGWAVLVLACAVAVAPAAEPVPVPVRPVEEAEEPPLKDLTPAGFADLIPPDDHARHTPGHLTPIVPEGRGFFLNADYFLMKPRADDTDYAVRTRTLGLAAAGGVYDVRYRVGNGVRVEAGYRLPDLGLEASVAYSYFSARGDDTIGADPGQLLRPTRTRPGLIDAATSADASLRFDADLYDVLVGRRWAIDDHFAVRGFAGVRFANLRQDFDVRYNGLDARDAQVFFRSRFQGVGPVAGGEGVFAWPRGFHLYARGSGGLLSGVSEEYRRETNDGGRTVYTDLPVGVRKVVPVVSLGVGGGFQHRAFSVRAGYEVTHWFGLTDRLRATSDVAPGSVFSRPGNLSIDGFFVSVGFAF